MSADPRSCVLLTRPRPDAEATARVLARHGIDSVIAPLIDIVDLPVETIDLAGVQALLVTSANGVRALARATAVRDLPVLAVGDASAAAAVAAGFADVTSAGGDVAALAELVCARLDARAGALLHAAGTAVAGDLAGELTQHGFEVRRLRLYDARTVARLPEAAERALADGTIAAALFYSPRTAGQFAKLVTAQGLADLCRPVIAVCLSAAVADALTALPFAERRIAATPDQDALIAALIDKT